MRSGTSELDKTKRREERVKKRSSSMITIAAFVMIGWVIPIVAQSSDENYHKAEFAISYSHARAASTFESETALIPEEGALTTRYCSQEGADGFGPNFQQFFCQRKGMNGFDASATFNFSRYFGIKGNVSSHFKSESFVDTFEIGPGETFTSNVNTRERLYNFMAGLQIKDNGTEARVRPFAHALFGAARQTVNFQQPASDGSSGFDANANQTSFAMKLGGGLDVRVSKRVDVRLFEFNYNPIFAGDRPLAGAGITVPITVNGRTAHNFTFGVGIVFH
jgi:hypothetical protein